MVTINPAECDRTTVYTGECRNLQDTEWIRFDSGRRRSPNAHDGDTWLIDVGYGSFWVADDQVRNLVRLVPAPTGGQWTRDDLPDPRDLYGFYQGAVYGRSVTARLAAAVDAVVEHLNAHHPKPDAQADAEWLDRALNNPDEQLVALDEARIEANIQRNRAERERDAAVERAEKAETDAEKWNLHCLDGIVEATYRPAVTRDEVWRVVAAHDPGDDEMALCRVNRLTDAVWPLVSGDDPAVFVVRESDVAAVEVEHDGRGWHARGATWSHEPTAEGVRDGAKRHLRDVAQYEAVARAIEADAEPADPVEAKAREFAAIAFPDEPGMKPAWETATEETRTAFTRIAAHVLGQEASDE